MVRKINFERQLDLFDSCVEEQRPDFELDAQPSQQADRSTRYSPEIIKKAMILFGRGVSYKTVANSLSIPVYTAREWRHLYRNNTLEQHIQGHLSKRKYPEAIKEKVIRMRVEQGMSYNRIVQETGISRTTIRSWLAGLGRRCQELELSVLMDGTGAKNVAD